MSDNNIQQLLDRINVLSAELDRIKRYDTLTRLYNKSAYFESARRRIDRNPDKDYVIVCLDIEKFKYINDRFGFLEGDRLISYIGEKLYERSVNCGAIAARINADRFSFLDERKNIDTEAFGKEVQTWVKDYPIDADIRVVVGVYPVNVRDIPIRLMCDRANMAIAQIKHNHMICAAEYNKDISDYIFEQNKLLGDVERAFKQREFKVYLQPKYDIRTNKIIGAESLVRWCHSERGLVSPNDFIPLFEQNMIITRLDEYIWEDTCRIISEWKEKGYKIVPVSVNVSRIDIYSIDVVNKFLELTDKYGIERDLIEIEITESAFTNDENKLLNTVDELRNNGFKVLMDDFGSGYSSLNILKDINVDVLKIDTRFLEPGRNNNDKGREILESVIRMAKWIGLQTVAEGVETEEHKKFLIDLGCYYAQGYYFSRPVPENVFGELIKNPDNVSDDDGIQVFDNIIAIEELFHSDFMTENLLNNILGGVAIYAFEKNEKLTLMKANDFYYDLKKRYSFTSDENLLDDIHPDDKKMLLDAFRCSRDVGAHGTAVNVRVMNGEKEQWLSIRVFFLADRESYGLYYASVADFNEQMHVMAELEMSRAGFETALELIDAILLEYNFYDKSLTVRTRPSDGQEYLLGTKIENALRLILNNHVVHDDYQKDFEAMCRHLKNSEEPFACAMELKRPDLVFRMCSVTAKTVRNEKKKPVKAIIVVKPID